MKDKSFIIRESRMDETGRIMDIHRAAFDVAEGETIAQLVSEMLADPTAMPLSSLVAEGDGALLGHVLFTAVHVVEGGKAFPGQILAPLAVRPGVQGQGVGGALVSEGLQRLSANGVGLVFVLGHPSYYPRFGFESAGPHGFDSPHAIPGEAAEAWMVLELQPGHIGRIRGRVRCCEALNHPRHWRE
jgi:predicted N-acetyltransferase YhbS